MPLIRSHFRFLKQQLKILQKSACRFKHYARLTLISLVINTLTIHYNQHILYRLMLSSSLKLKYKHNHLCPIGLLI